MTTRQYPWVTSSMVSRLLVMVLLVRWLKACRSVVLEPGYGTSVAAPFTSRCEAARPPVHVPQRQPDGRASDWSTDDSNRRRRTASSALPASATFWRSAASVESAY